MKPVPTSQHTPGVDYHATSRRLRFDELPAAVRAAVEQVLGSSVVEADEPVTSGFTRAYAGRVLLEDGRQVFLKATGPDLPIPVKALRREAQILKALADQIPAVPMIGSGASSDGGRVLALEWVEGHLPGFPWTGGEIALVREACESVATVPASALAGVAPGRLADDLRDDDQLQGELNGGLAMPASLERLPDWLPERIDEVLRLARLASTLLVGDHLNHFDLRPDNVLIERRAGEMNGRAYLLDWNWVTLGPPWCDWVGLIPSMHDQGLDLVELLASSRLSSEADPEAIDAFFAVIAVYMLCLVDNAARPQPLRDHMRYFARVLLGSLAAHRGWQ